MNFRLRTSKKVEKHLKYLQSVTNLSPNILARVAVSLSLLDPSLPDKNLIKDPDGLEISRSTLTGEYDYVYKALMTQHAKKEISDTFYFPTLFNLHLERGIVLLVNEYKHAGNYDRFITNLIQLN